MISSLLNKLIVFYFLLLKTMLQNYLYVCPLTNECGLVGLGGMCIFIFIIFCLFIPQGALPFYIPSGRIYHQHLDQYLLIS